MCHVSSDSLNKFFVSFLLYNLTVYLYNISFQKPIILSVTPLEFINTMFFSHN